MKHISEIIDDILVEWSYRVHDGMPNPKNPLHLTQLQESLDELKLPRKVSEKLLQNLRELEFDDAESFKKYKAKHKMRPNTKVTIGDKETTVKDAEGGDKKPKEKEEKKDKTLKQDIDYNNPPETITNDSPPSDEDFKNNKRIKEHTYNPSEIEVGGQKVSLPITQKTLESIFKTPPHKFPKRYLKTLERILNTQQIDANNPKITEFLNSKNEREKVGAGQISAQASELLMLMATSLPDAEANVLFELLEKTVDATEGSNQILDKEWIGASRGMRNSALKNIREVLGDDAVVEFSGWDSTMDWEDGIGMSDVAKNKGFSTDTVFRVKTPDGKSYIAEVSNKKDLNIFLGSPSAAGPEKKMMENGVEIEESRQAGKYTENAKKRSDERINNTTQDDLDKLEKMDNMSDEELIEYLSKLPDELRQMFTTGDKKKGLKLKPIARKYLKMKDIPLPWDTSNSEWVEKAKEIGFPIGTQKGANKGAIFMNYLLYADELNNGKEDGPAMNFINNQVGIIGKEPFPKGSQRDVQNHFVENLHKPESRAAVMGTIKEKFPLKNLLDGEETMSLGSFRLSPDICQEIFGTTDYNKIEENLDIKKDEDGNYFLSYTVEVDGKKEEIEIAKIGARGKGIGYSNITMEMSMSPQFAHTTYCANMKSKNPPKEEDLTKDEKTQVAKLTRRYGKCK